MNPYYLCVIGLDNKKQVGKGCRDDCPDDLIFDKYCGKIEKTDDKNICLQSFVQLLNNNGSEFVNFSNSLDELCLLISKYVPLEERNLLEISGNNPKDSIVLIFPSVVIKLFHHSTELVELKLRKQLVNYENWVPYLGHIQNDNLKAIVYSNIKILDSSRLHLISYSELLKILFDIGTGLDKLHSLGYIHGDPGHSNIGLNQQTNQWALIDFEDIKFVGDDNSMFFQDISDCISDFLVSGRLSSEVNHKISNLWSSFKQSLPSYTIEKTIIFLNKEKKRTMTMFDYRIGDWTSAISSLL